MAAADAGRWHVSERPHGRATEHTVRSSLCIIIGRSLSQQRFCFRKAESLAGRNPCQTWKLFAACSETIDCQKRRPGQKHNLRAMIAQILHTSGISALQSSSGRHAATPIAQLTSPPKRVHHFASPSQRPLRAHNVRLHAVMAPEVRSSSGSVV